MNRLYMSTLFRPASAMGRQASASVFHLRSRSSPLTPTVRFGQDRVIPPCANAHSNEEHWHEDDETYGSVSLRGSHSA
jgi:hypothetical protein